MVQKDSRGWMSLCLTATETKDEEPKGEGLENGCNPTGVGHMSECSMPYAVFDPAYVLRACCKATLKIPLVDDQHMKH